MFWLKRLVANPIVHRHTALSRIKIIVYLNEVDAHHRIISFQTTADTTLTKNKKSRLNDCFLLNSRNQLICYGVFYESVNRSRNVACE